MRHSTCFLLAASLTMAIAPAAHAQTAGGAPATGGMPYTLGTASGEADVTTTDADDESVSLAEGAARQRMLAGGCHVVAGDPNATDAASEAVAEELASCVATMERSLGWTEEAFAGCSQTGVSERAKICQSAMATFLRQHVSDEEFEQSSTPAAAKLMKDVCAPSVLCERPDA